MIWLVAVLSAAMASAQTNHSVCQRFPNLNWCNATLTYTQRAELLAAEMIGNLTDVVAALSTFTPAVGPPVERLHFPAFQWHSEGLHGLRNSMDTVGFNATLFPQVTGLVSAGNVSVIEAMTEVMAVEARALNNIAQQNSFPLFGRGASLTYWSPTMNIAHDQRWGRAQESLGSEDPYLTGLLSAKWIRQFQGPFALDPQRPLLRVGATCKHFAAYSFEGSSPHANVTRHSFNAIVSRGDLNASYLPIFHACVVQSSPSQVMCSYPAITILDHYGQPFNASVDAIPACLHKDLLTGQLRDAWGYGLDDAFVVSDQGAIRDAYGGHHFSPDAAHASATAVLAGCDQNDGRIYNDNLPQAVKDGLVDLPALNTSLKRILAVEFRTGLYDPPSTVPWLNIPSSALDSDPHRRAALDAARQSPVLVKNDKGALPLDLAATRTIAVVGPMANYPLALMGAKLDYHPSFAVSHLVGLLNLLNNSLVADRVHAGQSLAGLDVGVLPGVELGPGYGFKSTDDALATGFDPHFGALPITEGSWASTSGPTVRFAQGSKVTEALNPGGIESAKQAVKDADVVVAVVGIDSTVEGEGRDRPTRLLPQAQLDLLQAIQQARPAGSKLVVVLVHGGALSMDWAAANADAIVDAFEGGQSGGQALAEILAGVVNPSGMLPFTIYDDSFDKQVSIANMSFLDGPGRTFRYYTGTPRFAFGHGLSYTSFKFDWQQAPPSAAPLSAAGALAASVKVTNTGSVAGATPVLAFASSKNPSSPYTPQRQLYGIDKVFLRPGESRTVTFSTATAIRSDTRALKPLAQAVPEWKVGADEPSAEAAVQDLSRGWCALCDVSSTGRRFVQSGTYELSIGSDGAGNGGVSAHVQLQPLKDGTQSIEVPLL